MKQLIFDKKTELSVQLKNQLNLTNLNALSTAAHEAQLIFFSLLEQATSKLGWAEHTGDWDLYLKIILKSGDEIITTPGYSALDYDPNHVIGLTPLIFSIPDEDEDNEEITHTIPALDIQSIQLCD